MRTTIRATLTLAVAGLLAAAVAQAETRTIDIIPCDVPDEQLPRINPGDFPAGFDADSWQGPSTGKSNWHARYLANGDWLSELFPNDAATLTIADITSISYFTNRPVGIPDNRDWWVQIYTRVEAGDPGTWWYHNRFINNYHEHGTADGLWTQHSTDDASWTFRCNGHCADGPASYPDFVSAHGTELIEMISIQTDSGWNGFDGYMDGLEITLANGNIGRVNFEAGFDVKTVDVYRDDVPDEEIPRLNAGDYPTDYADNSWQGPAVGKSNWHARYLANGDYLSILFPEDAETMTIADLASINYFTKRPVGIPDNRDWWVQIYTRPEPGDPTTWWYHNRFINNYQEHGPADDTWTRHSTDDSGWTFRCNGHCADGPASFSDFVAAHGTELVEMISIQTDSGWNGFDGFMDGLEITLTNCKVGQVNFEGFRSIDIDVRPKNTLNQINTGARQVVPIAILGSEAVDPCSGATAIDDSSVEAHGATPSTTRTRCDDVNGDGYTDMVLYFRARSFDSPTTEECNDPNAQLVVTGSNQAGETVTGSDSVNWLNCN